jgi:hypothetical protein
LTFFLITPESKGEVEAGRAAFDFRHPAGGGLTTDPRQPEEAIAFPEEDVRQMLAEASLAVREPIRHGGWANTHQAPSFQDLVIVGTEPPEAA